MRRSNQAAKKEPAPGTEPSAKRRRTTHGNVPRPQPLPTPLSGVAPASIHDETAPQPVASVSDPPRASIIQSPTIPSGPATLTEMIRRAQEARRRGIYTSFHHQNLPHRYEDVPVVNGEVQGNVVATGYICVDGKGHRNRFERSCGFGFGLAYVPPPQDELQRVHNQVFSRSNPPPTTGPNVSPRSHAPSRNPSASAKTRPVAPTPADMVEPEYPLPIFIGEAGAGKTMSMLTFAVGVTDATVTLYTTADLLLENYITCEAVAQQLPHCMDYADCPLQYEKSQALKFMMEEDEAAARATGEDLPVLPHGLSWTATRDALVVRTLMAFIAYNFLWRKPSFEAPSLVYEDINVAVAIDELDNFPGLIYGLCAARWRLTKRIREFLNVATVQLIGASTRCDLKRPELAAGACVPLYPFLPRGYHRLWFIQHYAKEEFHQVAGELLKYIDAGAGIHTHQLRSLLTNARCAAEVVAPLLRLAERLLKAGRKPTAAELEGDTAFQAKVTPIIQKGVKSVANVCFSRQIQYALATQITSVALAIAFFGLDDHLPRLLRSASQNDAVLVPGWGLIDDNQLLTDTYCGSSVPDVQLRVPRRLLETASAIARRRYHMTPALAMMVTLHCGSVQSSLDAFASVPCMVLSWLGLVFRLAVVMASKIFPADDVRVHILQWSPALLNVDRGQAVRAAATATPRSDSAEPEVERLPLPLGEPLHTTNASYVRRDGLPPNGLRFRDRHVRIPPAIRPLCRTLCLLPQAGGLPLKGPDLHQLHHLSSDLTPFAPAATAIREFEAQANQTTILCARNVDRTDYASIIVCNRVTSELWLFWCNPQGQRTFTSVDFYHAARSIGMPRPFSFPRDSSERAEDFTHDTYHEIRYGQAEQFTENLRLALNLSTVKFFVCFVADQLEDPESPYVWVEHLEYSSATFLCNVPPYHFDFYPLGGYVRSACPTTPPESTTTTDPVVTPK